MQLQNKLKNYSITIDTMNTKKGASENAKRGNREKKKRNDYSR